MWHTTSCPSLHASAHAPLMCATACTAQPIVCLAACSPACLHAYVPACCMNACCLRAACLHAACMQTYVLHAASPLCTRMPAHAAHSCLSKAHYAPVHVVPCRGWTGWFSVGFWSVLKPNRPSRLFNRTSDHFGCLKVDRNFQSVQSVWAIFSSNNENEKRIHNS